MPDNSRNFFVEAVRAAIESLYKVGKIGRSNADGTTTIIVPGRSHFVYVQTGAGDTTGLIEAFNAHAPRKAGVPVRMMRVARTWVIVGVDEASGDVDANTYNVVYHVHSRKTGLPQPVTELDGMPNTLAGGAGQILKVASDESGFYLADAPAGTEGPPGADGADGKSAYEIAVDNGYPGDETSWLASLVGPAGADGATGPTGATGPAGADGDAAAIAVEVSGAGAVTTLNNADLLAAIVSGVLKQISWTSIKTLLSALFVGKTGDESIDGVKTFTGQVNVGDGTTLAAYNLNGASGQVRQISFRTAGSNRWIMFADNVAESGSNAGSNYVIRSRTDAGTLLRDNLTVNRANGNWTIDGTVRLTGSLDVDTDLNVDGNAVIDGMLAVGVTSPQGQLHLYDGTAGWLKGSKTGVVGTEVTIIPNGAGDVAGAYSVRLLAKGSSGTIVRGTWEDDTTFTDADTPASASVEIGFGFDSGAGANRLTLKLYSTGQLTIRRTAGTETWKVAVDLMWL